MTKGDKGLVIQKKKKQAYFSNEAKQVDASKASNSI